MSDLPNPAPDSAMPASPLPEPREAGRELDAMIADRVMGISLDVPRERAMAMLGASYTVVTGPTFSVYVPGFENRIAVPMPDGETIGGHESDDNYNQRYFRYVAQHLLDFPNEIGERVARDLASIRGTPKPYSTDIAAAWTVIEAMEKRGATWVFGRDANGLTGGFEITENEPHVRVAETVPLLICIAALATVDAEPSHV